MSAFAVFGFTRTLAMATAKRRVKALATDSIADYRAKLDAEADRIFKTAKPKQVSGLFDAPQFAEDFIKTASGGGQIRDAVVFAKVPVIDSNGATATRKKSPKPRLVWRPYADYLNGVRK